MSQACLTDPFRSYIGDSTGFFFFNLISDAFTKRLYRCSKNYGQLDISEFGRRLFLETKKSEAEAIGG